MELKYEKYNKVNYKLNNTIRLFANVFIKKGNLFRLFFYFNPKFTSQPVNEELRAMGLEERRPSFFYEKVFGRTGGG